MAPLTCAVGDAYLRKDSSTELPLGFTRQFVVRKGAPEGGLKPGACSACAGCPGERAGAVPVLGCMRACMRPLGLLCTMTWRMRARVHAYVWCADGQLAMCAFDLTAFLTWSSCPHAPRCRRRRCCYKVKNIPHDMTRGGLGPLVAANDLDYQLAWARAQQVYHAFLEVCLRGGRGRGSAWGQCGRGGEGIFHVGICVRAVCMTAAQ